MVKPPKFLKDFSKEYHSEARDQAAKEIREKRRAYFQEQKDNQQRQLDHQQEQAVLAEQVEEQSEQLVQQLAEIDQLKETIGQMSLSGLDRLVNYFKLRGLKADLTSQQADQEVIEQAHQQLLAKQEAVKQKKVTTDYEASSLEDGQRILKNFYQRLKKDWANTPYSKEEISHYFSEEHLASLSLEDYGLLLSRFPQAMVTHVTRQGVRDHTGMIFHSAGQGSYSDGFMRIVADGRLRSPLGVYLVEQDKQAAISRFLGLDSLTKEEALRCLDSLVGGPKSGAGGYADRQAIHFATEEVADYYYGSERGNEIFFAYPSAHIASQYYFYGQLKSGGGGYWNDAWVWANEEKGMDINAGIVFIPAEAPVDPETGSRYQLDQQKEPVVNQDYLEKVYQLINHPDFQSFADQAKLISGQIRFSDDFWNHPENQSIIKELQPYIDCLKQEFAVTDPRLQQALLSYRFLDRVPFYHQAEDTPCKQVKIEGAVNEALKEQGIYFVEAQKTITSQEFWQKYFQENPQQQPNKIIYYQGNDPTKALHQWQGSLAYNSKDFDGTIGFSERHVETSSYVALAGLDRFRALAQQVIDQYYD